MPQFGGNPASCCERSDGGVGAAVYSVKASPLNFGESGVATPLPLIKGSSDMMIVEGGSLPESPKDAGI